MKGKVEHQDAPMASRSRKDILWKTLLLVGVLYLFLLSIELLGAGFRLFNLEATYLLFSSTANPFVAFFIGILATAVVQSSSTITSMVVALVAAGTISIENAVPLVMGANIGTTLTSTFVALNFFGTRKQLHRAIVAATSHDFFNIVTAIILFPLELSFGVLSKTSRLITSWITPDNFESSTAINLLNWAIKPLSDFLERSLHHHVVLILLLGCILVIVSISYMSILLKSFLLPSDEAKINQVFFSSRYKSMLWGIGITAGIQSSSVTTSIMVPYVALNKIPIARAFPFIIGANVGTTFTALIASISQSQAAITIAICHLLFNVFGALLHFPPFFSRFSLSLARYLGNLVMRFRASILIYMSLLFFVIPVGLIIARVGKVEVTELIYQKTFPNQQKPVYSVWLMEQSGADGKITIKVYEGLSEAYEKLGEATYFEVLLQEADSIFPLAVYTIPKSLVAGCVELDRTGETKKVCLVSNSEMKVADYINTLEKVKKFTVTSRTDAKVDSAVLWVNPETGFMVGREVFRNGNLLYVETLKRKS
jgi:sodium-dependent phosphate cotransporter